MRRILAFLFLLGFLALSACSDHVVQPERAQRGGDEPKAFQPPGIQLLYPETGGQYSSPWKKGPLHVSQSYIELTWEGSCPNRS